MSREVARYHSARHGTKNPLGRSLPPGRARRPYRWGYQAQWAQRRADTARRRPKASKLRPGTRLRHTVAGKLARRWSPKQIAAWLRATYADRPESQVSHETIYQAIYVQSRGNLRAELGRQVALRSGRTQRRPQSRAAGAARSRRPWIGDLHISTRPAEATDRAVPGHWEGDLVIGKAGASAIVTLVERATRYVMLGALPNGRDSDAVIAVLTTLATRMPAHLLRSLTWDQGVEMATHPVFTVATGCPVYFCDPHSPWQRGSNENTNGLLRQYFPKSSYDFRTIDQTGLDEVAHELNTRPRETLDWNTPAQRLAQLITP
ncbi:IS30 family transposase [Micromonospora sp. C51]|uniref:IS30 family transposase n=1 Tax=Micromonospora sp. C51 TaxID=2824879 RepID=UPI0027DC0212|nr:IS30 family transposase [Micromonospora sp. C51]